MGISGNGTAYIAKAWLVFIICADQLPDIAITKLLINFGKNLASIAQPGVELSCPFASNSFKDNHAPPPANFKLTYRTRVILQGRGAIREISDLLLWIWIYTLYNNM